MSTTTSNNIPIVEASDLVAKENINNPVEKIAELVVQLQKYKTDRDDNGRIVFPNGCLLWVE